MDQRRKEPRGTTSCSCQCPCFGVISVKTGIKIVTTLGMANDVLGILEATTGINLLSNLHAKRQSQDFYSPYLYDELPPTFDDGDNWQFVFYITAIIFYFTDLVTHVILLFLVNSGDREGCKNWFTFVLGELVFIVAFTLANAGYQRLVWSLPLQRVVLSGVSAVVKMWFLICIIFLVRELIRKTKPTSRRGGGPRISRRNEESTNIEVDESSRKSSTVLII